MRIFFFYAFFMPACVFFSLSAPTIILMLVYSLSVSLFFFSLFVRNVCFIYFLCVLEFFFFSSTSFCQKCLFFSKLFFVVKRRSYLVFVIVFNRKPFSKLHDVCNTFTFNVQSVDTHTNWRIEKCAPTPTTHHPCIHYINDGMIVNLEEGLGWRKNEEEEGATE